VLAARQGATAGAPAPLNNLPVQLSTFIGRARELAEVRALVESSRLVTLAGAGGCGKTRLSLQLAAGLLDGPRDGVWLVELAAVTDGDVVASAISQALRLAAQPGRPALEARLNALAPQDALIVLDNCEHLIGSCARTAEAIVRRCPRVRLVATSREPLGISGETIYRVPSLSLAEPAVTAFRYRLLETIRLFAADRLVEAGSEEAAAVAAAHCAHFLSLAEVAAAHLTGPEQGSWLARLDADQDNLRRAAGHAADDSEGTALALRLGVALERYWIARSRQQEGFGLLVPALRRPEARADPALFAVALVTAAHAAFFIDVATARHLAERSVQVARQLGDERLLARSLAALCGACFFAGEPEAGRPFGQESLERARRLADDVQLADRLLRYLLTIDPAQSGRLFSEAIACTEPSARAPR
jgi:hypothetical protein